jgi:hypothetical protein
MPQLNLPEATLDALGMLAPDCCCEPRELRDRPELDPHADQERLFDSLVELFQALTRRAPLLIVLEDVHWADSGTLSMCALIAPCPAMPAGAHLSRGGAGQSRAEHLL